MRIGVTLTLVLALLLAAAAPALGHPDHDADDQKGVTPPDTPARRMIAEAEAPEPAGFTPCIDGEANGYPCAGVDLLGYLPVWDIGEGLLNDLWGWNDPVTGSRYALVGNQWGTVFVDITEPTSPAVVGRLPTQTSSSRWRDIKVIDDHAVIVSEAPGHGMQIFDLTQLRGAKGPGNRFTATAHYDGFGNAHNVGVNTTSRHAVAVGSDTCAGGPHFVDLSEPSEPRFAGCYSGDGYTHDIQCVRYLGPDTEHRGRDLCLASNEDTLTIIDATDPSFIRLVSRTGYTDSGYTHQGWLTDDQRFFVVDDELDEILGSHGTRTYLWDVSDLDAPPEPVVHTSRVRSTDHNLYVADGYAYQANYRAGLRILDLKNIVNGEVEEVAHFDIYPSGDGTIFSGAWTAYPFHGGNVVTVSGIEQGLFVLGFTAKRPSLAGPGLRATGPF